MQVTPKELILEEGIAPTLDTWEAFGLGGSWKGLAADRLDARLKAFEAGVLSISWIKRVEPATSRNEPPRAAEETT